MLSLTQMCKIWEEQSFINISKVSLSSPRFKKKKKYNFNKMFKIFVGQKHNRSINMRS